MTRATECDKEIKRRLEEYRFARRELMDLRSRMHQASRRAAQSGRETDRRRADAAVGLYDALADRLSEELYTLEDAIETLPEARMRQALRLRYIDGCSRARTAIELEVSERTVVTLVGEAVEMLERETLA